MNKTAALAIQKFESRVGHEEQQQQLPLLDALTLLNNQ